MGFLDTVKGGLSKAGQATKEFTEVQGIKLKKSKLEGEVKNLYLDLGRIYYTKMKSGEINVSVDDVIIKKIDETIDAIAQLDDDIVSAKGISYCTKCGAELTKGTLFCTNCGQRVSEEAEEKESVNTADDIASTVDFGDEEN